MADTNGHFQRWAEQRPLPGIANFVLMVRILFSGFVYFRTRTDFDRWVLALGLTFVRGTSRAATHTTAEQTNETTEFGRRSSLK